ncbi:MAG: hypothetical protein DRI65_02130 [Chloroflexota bacterium]|nr:MAG: hypothetical protein DRI65_02130 [Chloroflexota bacterium]
MRNGILKVEKRELVIGRFIISRGENSELSEQRAGQILLNPRPETETLSDGPGNGNFYINPERRITPNFRFLL